MNIVFLNLSSHAIGGVAEAFRADKLQNVNLRDVIDPAAEVRNYAEAWTTDTIIIGAAEDTAKTCGVIREIRNLGINQPIILLHDYEGNKKVRDVMGAGLVVLPVALDRELKTNAFGIDSPFLRQRALDLHHERGGQQAAEFRFHAFLITEAKPSKIFFLGEQLDLTQAECGLLKKIIRKRGEPLTNEEAVNRLYLFGEEPESDVIAVMISRIRKKLRIILEHKGHAAGIEVVATHYNGGYAINIDTMKQLTETALFTSSIAAPTTALLTAMPDISSIFSLNPDNPKEVLFLNCRLSPEQSQLWLLLLREPGKLSLSSDLRHALGCDFDGLADITEHARISMSKTLKKLNYPSDISLIESIGQQGKRLDVKNLTLLLRIKKQNEKMFDACGFSLGLDGEIHLRGREMKTTPMRQKMGGALIRAKGNALTFPAIFREIFLPIDTGENVIRQHMHYLNHEIMGLASSMGLEHRKPLIGAVAGIKSYRIFTENFLETGIGPNVLPFSEHTEIPSVPAVTPNAAHDSHGQPAAALALK